MVKSHSDDIETIEGGVIKVHVRIIYIYCSISGGFVVVFFLKIQVLSAARCCEN